MTISMSLTEVEETSIVIKSDLYLDICIGVMLCEIHNI